jgi:hypothetical protein
LIKTTKSFLKGNTHQSAEIEYVTLPGSEPEPEPHSAPVATNSRPVLYGSGSGSDFFMHSIVLNAEIEMNPTIDSAPEPVPVPKTGSGSRNFGTVPYGSGSD